MRRALDGWGWSLALVIALSALIYAAWAPNPVEEAEDQAAAVARSVGIIEGRCPDGFSYNNIAGHTVSETCAKGSLVVTLYPPPLDKYANYGLDTMDPQGTEIPCERIPGWPRDRCAP